MMKHGVNEKVSSQTLPGCQLNRSLPCDLKKKKRERKKKEKNTRVLAILILGRNRPEAELSVTVYEWKKRIIGLG